MSKRRSEEPRLSLADHVSDRPAKAPQFPLGAYALLPNGSISEGYLRGDHCHIGVRIPRNPYYAFYNRQDDALHFGSASPGANLGEGFQAQQRSVLVDVVESDDAPEVTRVPSLVWLYARQEYDPIRADAAFYSFRSAGLELLPGWPDGKIDVLKVALGERRLRSPAALPRERECHMIEGRPQIVESIPGGTANLRPDRASAELMFRIALAARVTIRPAGVRVRFAETPEAQPKLFDVLVGPLVL